MWFEYKPLHGENAGVVAPAPNLVNGTYMFTANSLEEAFQKVEVIWLSGSGMMFQEVHKAVRVTEDDLRDK